jgi:putative effector of murein hydrolase
VLFRSSVVAAAGATIAAYLLVDRVARRLGAPAYAAPVLWSPILLLAVITVARVDIAGYVASARPLIWLLGPAVVALGAPAANSLRQLGGPRRVTKVIAAVLLGGMASSFVSVAVAAAFGADRAVIGVVSVKSVTAPLAIAIPTPFELDHRLVAATCVLAGVYGAVVLPVLARRLRLQEGAGYGLGVGVTAHGIGAGALGRSEPGSVGLAVAGLAINGVFTAVWLPPLLEPMLRLFGR